MILHCAAYTNVDGAETNPDIAYKVNGIGTRNIALASQEIDAAMLYISTDYVFDGEADLPYDEYANTNPISIYGCSKYAGEFHLRELLNKFYIIRTSWLYGKNGKNFVNTMLKLASKQNIISVVDDQRGCPTYTMDLAEQILRLIQVKGAYGTYHITNQGDASWFEFAEAIFELVERKEIELEAITTREMGRPAPRPEYSVLRGYHLELTIGNTMRHWKEALKDYLSLEQIKMFGL